MAGLGCESPTHIEPRTIDQYGKSTELMMDILMSETY